ncbi:MAG: 3'(2'),5'-bisphosphate nucleotidase CysQ [Cytophagaceae bacterium]|nr:3'(2'),5'-bisphosphate nucleotidase CysQ [Cytophagaceae bacterium]
MYIESHIWPAIEAAIQAGKPIIDVYERSFEVLFKADKSPITEADKKARTIINSYLEKTQIPILSEEEYLPEYKERSHWKSCWIVDPLDGTKEFVKKTGEFTVNIALIENAKPVFGIIYVPTIKMLYLGDTKTQTAIRVAIDIFDEIKASITQKAIPLYGISNSYLPLNDSHNASAKPSLRGSRPAGEPSDKPSLRGSRPAGEPSDTPSLRGSRPQGEHSDKAHQSALPLRVLSSVSHMTDKTKAYIEALTQKGYKVDLLQVGSSLKFCMLAEGKADLYPRFGPTMEWDTAAGQAVCEAVGFEVIDQNTQKPIEYNRKNLRNNSFVVRPKNDG